MDKAELVKQLRIDRAATEAGPGRPSAFVWLAVAAALLAIAAAAYVWLQGDDRAPLVNVASVQAETASQPARSVLDATGYVTARRIATVSSQVTGQVESVYIEEGMTVEAGQVLAMLDDTEARAQLALAEAQLQAARSQLAEIRAQLGLARREQQRQEELLARGLGTQAGVDAANTQVETLDARLASGETAIAVAARSEEVARVRLDNTVIRAPFTGVVTVKAAQPGEMISPVSAGGGFTRTGIGTIVDMDSLEVQVDVNEAFIQRVRPGQRVEATLNAYPDWRIPAEVIAIIPTADRSRATVRVRIALLERDARIVPDMGVRVAFLSAAPEPAAEGRVAPLLLVPAAAVRESGGESWVFVLAEERVARRGVRLEPAQGDMRPVLEGLRSGERVVLRPPEGLRDGDRVRLE